MKKATGFLLGLVLLTALTGCSSGDSTNHAVTKAGDINDVIQSAIDAGDKQKESTAAPTAAPDATACCSQGIEFVLAGEHTFPDDYPNENAIITVTGLFDTYQEGEYRYCTLREAVMD